MCDLGRKLELGHECNALLVIPLQREQMSLFSSLYSLPMRSTICEAHSKEFLVPYRRKYCAGNHAPSKDSLRAVNYEWYLSHLRRKSSPFQPGFLICSTCRKEYNDLPQAEAHKKRRMTTSSDVLSPINDLLKKFDLAPLQNNIKGFDSLSRQLERTIISLVNHFVEVGNSCGIELSLNVEAGKEALKDIQSLSSNLKTHFAKVGFREKVQTLTLAPDSWSVRAIVENFSTENQRCTVYMAKKAKQLRDTSGNLSIPPKKIGRKIFDLDKKLIETFLYSDEISSCRPGMNDTKKVKGEVRPIRLLLMTLSDAYDKFKELHPNAKVGRSKFFEIHKDDYPEIRSPGGKGMHNVCVCQKHENVKFLVDVLGKSKDYFKTLMALVVCSTTEEKCMLGECIQCGQRKHIERLKEAVNSLLTERQCGFPLFYPKWIKNESGRVIIDKAEVEDSTSYVDLVVDEIYGLCAHHQITRTQNAYFKDRKENMEFGTAVIQLDFAENYSMLVQNAVAGYHWTNSQATVHPIVAYVRLPDGSVAVESVAIISDEMRHDTETVFGFQKIFLQWLIAKYPFLKVVEYFSDGCGGQYKNFKAFLNLYFHFLDFKVIGIWNYFATSHGKGSCDGIGGTLKRMTMLESLTREDGNFIVEPYDVFTFLHQLKVAQKILTFVFWVSSADVAAYSLTADLASRFALGKTVQGTLKYHRVESLQDGKMRFSRTSTTTDAKCIYVKQLFKPPTHNELDVGPSLNVVETEACVKRGDFLAVALDNGWYLGEVQSIEHDQMQIRYATTKGSLRNIDYSLGSEIDHVGIDSIICQVFPIAAGTTPRSRGKLRLLPIDIDKIRRNDF